jgi:hypothetical protein
LPVRFVESYRQRRALGGQPGRCPFLIGSKREAGMDAKTRDLVLLGAVSLFLAGFAWSWGHLFLGSVFFALGAVAVLGIAQRHWR